MLFLVSTALRAILNKLMVFSCTGVLTHLTFLCYLIDFESFFVPLCGTAPILKDLAFCLATV